MLQTGFESVQFAIDAIAAEPQFSELRSVLSGLPPDTLVRINGFSLLECVGPDGEPRGWVDIMEQKRCEENAFCGHSAYREEIRRAIREERHTRG